MREGWKEVELEELGTIGRGKSRHRPRNADFLYGNEYPFVQTADVKAAEYKITSYSQMYSEAGLTQSKLWPINTLCITIAANIADSSILGIEACFPDSVLGFISDPLKSDVKFVKYLFDMLQIRIKQISQGAAQDNLSLEKIRTLRFTVPNVETQRKIATILSGYDDLIENNLKRIKILEEMAQQTYEEWFVRMRFPGYETAVMNEETGLPEGWEKVKLGEIYDLKYGKNLAQTDILKEGTFSVYGASGKMGYFTKSNISSKKVLVTSRGNGSGVVHRTFEDESFVTNNSFVVNTELGLGYTFYNLKKFDLSRFNSGSAQPQLTNSALLNVEIIRPNSQLINDFNLIVNNQIQFIDNLLNQNQRLREARDLLLPRLMMGIVEV
jgi:type I restriction enzyme S subunit